MPPQNILISLRCAPLHQDILHRELDKQQYSIYTEKEKRATDQPLSAQNHFSAVDCFYRVFFAEPPHWKKYTNFFQWGILLSILNKVFRNPPKHLILLGGQFIFNAYILITK